MGLEQVVIAAKLAKELARGPGMYLTKMYLVSPIIPAVVPRSMQPDVLKNLVPSFEQRVEDDKPDELLLVGLLSCAYELAAGLAVTISTLPNPAGDYVGLALAADAVGRFTPTIITTFSNALIGTNRKDLFLQASLSRQATLLLKLPKGAGRQ